MRPPADIFPHVIQAIRENIREILLFFSFKKLKHLDCRNRNAGTGAEDCGDTCLVKEIIVLSGNNTAGSHHDVLAAEFLEFLDHLRNQGLVTCCK